MFLMHSMVDDAVPRSTEVPVEASALWKRGAPPGGPGKAEPLTGKGLKEVGITEHHESHYCQVHSHKYKLLVARKSQL